MPLELTIQRFSLAIILEIRVELNWLLTLISSISFPFLKPKTPSLYVLNHIVPSFELVTQLLKIIAFLY